MKVQFHGYDAELEAQPATIVIDLPLGKVTVDVPLEWAPNQLGTPILVADFDKATDAIYDAEAEGIA